MYHILLYNTWKDGSKNMAGIHSLCNELKKYTRIIVVTRKTTNKHVYKY